MDFSLNDTQTMLADSIDKFIANEYGFEARQKIVDSKAGFSNEVWQRFSEFGWTAVPFNEEQGGIDGGPVELMIVMERFGRGLVVEPYLANVVLAGGVLKRLATDEQKRRWLQPMIGGELQTALAFVEPQARYDIANVETSATADSDGWKLSGCKTYVLNGDRADIVIVPARTAGNPQDRSGITLFAVEANAEGLSRQSYETVDGGRAAEIALSDVDVDTNCVIGSVNGAYEALAATIADATLAVSAEASGIMSILTEKTIEYTKARKQFGVSISSFQALQHRIVDMYTACEQTRSLLLWATLTAAGKGGDVDTAVSSIKFQVGTAGRQVAEEAVQLHGGMGVTWELDVAHYFKRLIAIGQILGNADWHLDRLAA